MHTSRNTTRPFAFVAALAGILTLCLAFAAAAPAAQVGVRVLGQAPGFPTILPLTSVSTSGAQLVKDGGSCTPASAAAALEQATHGAWEGHWNSSFGDYEVLGIEGQSYPFDPSSNKNYYWSFWLDGSESGIGVCGAQLVGGDQVLFFPGCFGSECPSPPNVLGVQAPEAAEVGQPVSVTVVSHPSAGGQATPLAGASVTAGGAGAMTDTAGHASLTFAQAGVYAIHVTGQAGGAESVPGEANVSVTAATASGSTGAGGESAAGTPRSGVLSSAPYRGPFALVASPSGVIDGHVYPRGRGPRVLAGKVLGHSPVSSVALRLRRGNGRRCSAYDGVRERFLAARCGSGSYFTVSSRETFSYLLPAALARGRYVLDISATDAAGNRTALARGTSRIVFYVR